MQEVYINELNKMKIDIKKYDIIQGRVFYEQLTKKGSELNSYIGSIPKTKEEELLFMKKDMEISRLTDEIITQQLANARPSSNPKSGCYIATMVYGSYDHPQVLILRKFRDNVLSTYKIGVWFISKYYLYSPKMVRVFNDNKVINLLIRKVLNQIIKVIK